MISWRNVTAPRREVAEGNFKESDFAVNLVQAVKGNAAEEYSKAEEFFRRTYFTDGLKRLLFEALKRVTGHYGKPVIQVKTAFGGGKTHSMLALYHLMTGNFSAQRIPEIRALLADLDMSSLPRVRAAVVGGTDVNPAKPYDINGITVNTLCGDIAAQLGGYDFVREADRERVSPGAGTMQRMFDSCGPCLVLIDELSAYGSKLYGSNNLSAGTFDNFRVFVQELTEAAEASRNSIVVAAMPLSSLEAGGADGMRVLEILDNIFKRIDSVWKPVTAVEGYEVVKRRLFCECSDDSARERTAEEFFRMYVNNPSDFPQYARESKYRQKIIDCYPVHPEVFDRLYGEWSTLEKFQRTRGVLRFMAEVVHDLWVSSDSSALIMPGSINFASSRVREGLMSSMSNKEYWDSVIERDIDGSDSLAWRNDSGYQRYGESQACRKTARAVMLGSAPSNAAQSVRGIGKAGILLGTVQPGDNISVFTEALGTLRESSSYLYASDSGSSFWYDTRPTLRKQVMNRAELVSYNSIRSELRTRFKMAAGYPFSGLHIWPESIDVPDDENLRLVVLPPESGSAEAVQIVLSHGYSARTNRNRLLFLGTDSVNLAELTEKVRMYLAWKEIESDRSLDLTKSQVTEVRTALEKYSREIDTLIPEAWSVVLVPVSNMAGKVDDISCVEESIAGKAGSLQERTAGALKGDELSARWAAVHMGMMLEKLYWQKCGPESATLVLPAEYIAVKKLWEDVCRYCYMPRLIDREGLYEGIRDGVRRGIFAVAEREADGRYENLRMNEDVTVNVSDIIVRADIAKSLLESPKQKESPENPVPTPPEPPVTPPEPVPERKTHFHMFADLEYSAGLYKYVKTLIDEVVWNLHGAGGNLKVTLDVQLDAPGGIPEDIRDAVNEACRDQLKLKQDSYNFE